MREALPASIVRKCVHNPARPVDRRVAGRASFGYACITRPGLWTTTTARPGRPPGDRPAGHENRSDMRTGGHPNPIARECVDNGDVVHRPQAARIQVPARCVRPHT